MTVKELKTNNMSALAGSISAVGGGGGQGGNDPSGNKSGFLKKAMEFKAKREAAAAGGGAGAEVGAGFGGVMMGMPGKGMFGGIKRNGPGGGGGGGEHTHGMPFKMKASGSSPIQKNFGSKEHRGFGHNKPVGPGTTPLDMRSFGVGSIAGGVAGKGRSKTGPGGKFNN